MLKRMLVLSLLGVVVVGGAVAVLGSQPGAGPLTALVSLTGGGDRYHDGDNDDRDRDHDRDHDYEYDGSWGDSHDH